MSTLRDITCINKHTRKNCKTHIIPKKCKASVENLMSTQSQDEHKLNLSRIFISEKFSHSLRFKT